VRHQRPCRRASDTRDELAPLHYDAAKGNPASEKAVKDSSYNLKRPEVQTLYVGLTGDNVRLTLFWSAFELSAIRRNKIVHKSLIVDKSEAEASYQACSALVAQLKVSDGRWRVDIIGKELQNLGTVDAPKITSHSLWLLS
jgi:hypothetical protein